jgi:hypothetical protein
MIHVIDAAFFLDFLYTSNDIEAQYVDHVTLKRVSLASDLTAPTTWVSANLLLYHSIF